MSTRTKNVVKPPPTTSKHSTLSKKPKTKENSTTENTKTNENTAPSKSKISTTPRTNKKKDEPEDEKKKTQPIRTNPNSTRRILAAGRETPSVKKTTSSSARVKSRAEPPATPPSSRVTKSQFFPSKKMYTNALTNENKSIKRAPIRKENKPKPVPKNEEVSSDTSSMSERPRTATLRKGSIVNHNIVGPEAPPPRKRSPPPKVDSPVDYEDDFDSYESDFEAYSSSESTTNLNLSAISNTSSSSSDSSPLKSPPKRVNSASTDDEKKMDSGNYEMPESRHRQILDNIKESIEKENANLTQERVGSNLGSLSDEGFEDGKSLQFINFLGAQRKYKHRKSIQKMRQRGEEIMSMIRLDFFSFTLFDQPSVPYEDFIKTFGRKNTVQVSNQTGDDDLDEETQTEIITNQNKWTQFPSKFPKIDPDQNNFWEMYKCNYLGVGNDEIVPDIHKTNENRLEKPILNVLKLMDNLLSEKSSDKFQTETSSKIPFSQGVILCNVQEYHFLKNRPIRSIEFLSSNPNKFLTIHGTLPQEPTKSVICIWEIHRIQQPQTILCGSGEISCASFGSDLPDLIFAGWFDGTVSVWDTKEPKNSHNLVQKQPNEFFMQTPTFITEIHQNHYNPVISIKPLAKTSTNNVLFDTKKATEICSLDSDGDIIVWSVVFKERNSLMVENQGLAHWGVVILAVNVRISLRKMFADVLDFFCTDFCVSQLDSNHFYISTSAGVVLHCLANGGRTTVQKFTSEGQSQANCLEMCPFSSHYMLTGFTNGEIIFYSRFFKTPLKVMSNREDVNGKDKVEMIQWSRNRPLIIYTKDVGNTIHLWNLNVSDISPTHSIPFKEKIITFKLSPNNEGNNHKEKTYMIIATETGNIYIHLLNDEHGKQTLERFESEKRQFLHYINRFV